MMKTVNTIRITCWGLLLAIAVILYADHVYGPQSDRVVLYFEKVSGGIGAEVRFIPRRYDKPFTEAVIDEILLGPFDNRFLPLTDADVRPRSCFVRGGTVYIDLPKAVFFPEDKTSSLKVLDGLIKKNLLHNCKDVRSVYIYIDGLPAYYKKS